MNPLRFYSSLSNYQNSTEAHSNTPVHLLLTQSIERMQISVRVQQSACSLLITWACPPANGETHLGMGTEKSMCAKSKGRWEG